MLFFVLLLSFISALVSGFRFFFILILVFLFGLTWFTFFVSLFILTSTSMFVFTLFFTGFILLVLFGFFVLGLIPLSVFLLILLYLFLFSSLAGLFWILIWGWLRFAIWIAIAISVARVLIGLVWLGCRVVLCLFIIEIVVFIESEFLVEWLGIG